MTVRIEKIEGVYYASLEAKSGTSIMDVKKKNASFQKSNTTYYDIIKKVIKEYPKSDFIDYTKASSEVDELIVQYEETDFEFIKRLSTKLKTVVISDDSCNFPRFYLGVPTKKNVLLEKNSYSVIKNLSLFNDVYYNDSEGIVEKSFIGYQIVSGKILFVGDSVTFNDETLVVSKATSEMIKSELINTYTLVPEMGLGQKNILNAKIKGESLEGKVLEALDTSLKVQLDIDTETSNWFKYIPETSNFMYNMPCRGDKVKVYFPSVKEDEAIVTRVAYKASGGNSTLDPDTKYFSNPEGRRIQFAPKGIELKVKDDKLNNSKIFIKLNDEKGIEIISDNQIKIGSDSNITLKARNISIFSQQQVRILSCINARDGIIPELSKGIYINKNDISVKGTNTKFLGLERSYPFEQEPRPEFVVKSPTSLFDGLTPDWDRIKSGFGKFLKGALVAVAAVAVVAAVVCTGGAIIAAAAPLVAFSVTGMLATATIGAAAVGMAATVVGGVTALGIGLADAGEGIQDMYYGATGSKEESYNFVRDGIFNGDQEATDQWLDFGLNLMMTGAFVTFTSGSIFVTMLPATMYADNFINNFRSNSVLYSEDNGWAFFNKVGDKINFFGRKDGVGFKWGSMDLDEFMRNGGVMVPYVPPNTGMTPYTMPNIGIAPNLPSVFQNNPTLWNGLPSGLPKTYQGAGEAEANIDYVKLSEELGKKIETDGYKVINTKTAEQANKDWADMGFDLPPVAENTTVYNVKAGNFSYSRVYLDGYNYPKSRFILRTEDINGLSAEKIAQKYALPKVPNKIVTVELPSDTPLEVSIVGPQETWGTLGGDVQYAIKDSTLDDDWFSNIKDLK